MTQPVAAGRDGLGEGQQLRVARSSPSAAARTSGAEHVAGPADHDAAVADRAADDPRRVGQGVAEQRPAGSTYGSGHDHPDGAAGARATARPRRAPIAPVPRLPSGPSAAPDDHGRARRQADPRRRRRREREHRGGGQDRRQLVERDPGERRPRRGSSRARPCPASPVPDAEDSSVTSYRSAPQHVVLQPDPPAGARARRRLVPREPHELGQRRHRVHRCARVGAGRPPGRTRAAPAPRRAPVRPPR